MYWVVCLLAYVVFISGPPGPPTTPTDCSNIVWDAVTTFKRETITQIRQVLHKSYNMVYL